MARTTIARLLALGLLLTASLLVNQAAAINGKCLFGDWLCQ